MEKVFWKAEGRRNRWAASPLPIIREVKEGSSDVARERYALNM
jgi:hypothetical protein